MKFLCIVLERHTNKPLTDYIEVELPCLGYDNTYDYNRSARVKVLDMIDKNEIVFQEDGNMQEINSGQFTYFFKPKIDWYVDSIKIED